MKFDGVSVVTLKGDPGDKPTPEELLALMKPLIPKPIPGKPGKDGEDYVLTEKNKEEIAKKIKVPIVEKIVEKTEVIKEKPVVTEITKLIEKDITPEQLAEKLLTLKKQWIPIDMIDGDFNTKVARPVVVPGARPAYWQQKNLIGTIDGVNRTFTFEGEIPVEFSERVFLNYVEQNPLTDYVLTAKTVTYTVAPHESLSGLPHIIRTAY